MRALLPAVAVLTGIAALTQLAACMEEQGGVRPPSRGEGDPSGGGGGAGGGGGGGGPGGEPPGPTTDGGEQDAFATADASKLSTDRNAFFGPTRCATAGVAFCEDFEDALDTNTWTAIGTTKPTVDGTQHMRGAQALHISITGNGPSFVRTRKPFPALASAYWGRAFVRFGKMPGPPMNYSHWTFAAATGTGVSGEIRLGGQFQNGKNLFGVGTDNRTDDAGTGDWTNSDKDPNDTPRTVPTNEWMCIEWSHDGNTDETRFFWDAVEHPSLKTTKTMHGGNANPYVLPTFDAVWVGWQQYQSSTLQFEMWVDEVALDANRIGCTL